jgi:hypothetical protein
MRYEGHPFAVYDCSHRFDGAAKAQDECFIFKASGVQGVKFELRDRGRVDLQCVSHRGAGGASSAHLPDRQRILYDQIFYICDPAKWAYTRHEALLSWMSFLRAQYLPPWERLPLTPQAVARAYAAYHEQTPAARVVARKACFAALMSVR